MASVAVPPVVIMSSKIRTVLFFTSPMTRDATVDSAPTRRLSRTAMSAPRRSFTPEYKREAVRLADDLGNVAHLFACHDGPVLPPFDRELPGGPRTI